MILINKPITPKNNPMNAKCFLVYAFKPNNDNKIPGNNKNKSAIGAIQHINPDNDNTNPMIA